MKRFLCSGALALVCLFGASCGSTSRSNPGVDITGNWNVDLTEVGQSSPSYSFGLKFTKNAATISGTNIPYTAGPAHNTGCVNFSGMIATGSTNGGSVVTLVVTDPSTNSSFTLSGTADSSATQINGTFQATFGPNGSSPACPATNGTLLMNRQ